MLPSAVGQYQYFVPQNKDTVVVLVFSDNSSKIASLYNDCEKMGLPDHRWVIDYSDEDGDCLKFDTVCGVAQYTLQNPKNLLENEESTTAFLNMLIPFFIDGHIEINGA